MACASLSVDIKSRLPDIMKGIKGVALSGLEGAALVLEAKIADQVRSGRTPPPLKPATIAAKGSSGTLVDTGQMLGQITHQIEGDTAKVGVFGSRASIAAIHEFGAPGANIPERSFIRSNINDKKVWSAMEKAISKSLQQKLK